LLGIIELFVLVIFRKDDRRSHYRPARLPLPTSSHPASTRSGLKEDRSIHKLNMEIESAKKNSIVLNFTSDNAKDQGSNIESLWQKKNVKICGNMSREDIYENPWIKLEEHQVINPAR